MNIDWIDLMYTVIPFLAGIMVFFRFLEFRKSKYTDFLSFGRMIVDLYFTGLYLWISFDVTESLILERKTLVAFGILMLFGINIFYSIIRFYRTYLVNKIIKKNGVQ